LTEIEAGYYLTQFIEAMGVEETKKWLAKAKGLNNEE